ncbi:hypothetical protein Purlil1_11832 [Purpureocillium lilacinum]|uniref:Aminotransferase n=1 Tax=Purpureocillium lilacinum TaxID=33203 RepID=A0ABR0BIM9_PURLI|nr:hypothetical protein Purlil1_11832 [Purpureocillium lilacinum]
MPGEIHDFENSLSDRSEIPTQHAIDRPDRQLRNDGTALLHPLPALIPLAVRSASGCYVTLACGHTVLDAGAVTIVDHGSPVVLEAVIKQMKEVSYTHTLFHRSQVADDLAHLLVGKAPFGLSKAYFVSSGSEAMDAAMKLAIQYHIGNGQQQRQHFVSRKQSYHGNTIGAMSISSNNARKGPNGKSLQLSNVSFVEMPCAYRGKRDKESAADFTTRLIEDLNTEFQRVGPDKVAAFVAETIGGSTSGCVVSPPGYFEQVRALCDRYGILLILDEVMCGSGRTGTYFAFEAEGTVKPDLVTLGKGLAGGYAPIAAVLVQGSLYEKMEESVGGFTHGHTYQAHPVSCAAAMAVQQLVRQPNALASCTAKGLRLEFSLRTTFQNLKYVGDIRGRGLFWALEFVRDKVTKQPFASKEGFGVRVAKAAYSRGLALCSGKGTADGYVGDHVLLGPPLTISEGELEQIVLVLRQAYQDVVEEYEAACDNE